MELHISSDFPCVYSINGAFSETAERIVMNEFDAVYITVFPLALPLLPYTVKLPGAFTVHGELYDGIRLDDDNYILLLSPRYITVYGAANAAQPAPASPISRLFSAIKNGDPDAAMSLLGEQLKADIDKSALVNFFGGASRLIECTWEKSETPRFFLVSENGAARKCEYKLVGGFIDDINEL